MVAGLRWYLAAVGAGHSGCSHIYRPHTPQHRPRITRNNPQVVTEDDLIVPVCRHIYRRLRPRVHASLRLPDWQLCQPDELEMVAASFRSAQDLMRHLQRARRIEPSLAKLLPTVRHWIRALSYQQADLRRFLRDELGIAEGWR